MTRQMHRLSSLKRWGVVHTIQEQSVADHSFHVIRISFELCKILNLPVEVEALVIEYAIYHDAPEAFTGDIPSPTKTGFDDGLEPLEDEVAAFMGIKGKSHRARSELIEAVVKTADILECACFLEREVRMGNKMVEDIHAEIVNRAWEASLSISKLPQGIRYVKQIADYIGAALQDNRASPYWIKK